MVPFASKVSVTETVLALTAPTVVKVEAETGPVAATNERIVMSELSMRLGMVAKWLF